MVAMLRVLQCHIHSTLLRKSTCTTLTAVSPNHIFCEMQQKLSHNFFNSPFLSKINIKVHEQCSIPTVLCQHSRSQKAGLPQWKDFHRV